MAKVLKHYDQNIFYDYIWYPMLIEIGCKMNRKLRKPQNLINDHSYLPVLCQVSSKIWKKRKLIDQYLAHNKGKLRPEYVAVIQEWRDKAIDGDFIVIDHTPEGSILVSKEGYFLVKGVNNSWEELTLHMPLPVVVNTTLLPWKNCITTTALVTAAPFDLPAKQYNPIWEGYQLAKKNNAIITSL